jgi:DNA invertase Pin-like site-specific DNA recombinase
VQTPQSLRAWDVSVQFDLSTPHGKMIASVMAALAEFERDLIRERIKSGIAAAKARGKRLGRQPGQSPSDRKATKVLKLADAGLSYRVIGPNRRRKASCTRRASERYWKQITKSSV